MTTAVSRPNNGLRVRAHSQAWWALGDNRIILRAEVGRILGGPQWRRQFLPIGEELQSTGLHGLEVLAAPTTEISAPARCSITAMYPPIEKAYDLAARAERSIPAIPPGQALAVDFLPRFDRHLATGRRRIPQDLRRGERAMGFRRPHSGK